MPPWNSRGTLQIIELTKWLHQLYKNRRDQNGPPSVPSQALALKSRSFNSQSCISMGLQDKEILPLQKALKINLPLMYREMNPRLPRWSGSTNTRERLSMYSTIFFRSISRLINVLYPSALITPLQCSWLSPKSSAWFNSWWPPRTWVPKIHLWTPWHISGSFKWSER